MIVEQEFFICTEKWIGSDGWVDRGGGGGQRRKGVVGLRCFEVEKVEGLRASQGSHWPSESRLLLFARRSDGLMLLPDENLRSVKLKVEVHSSEAGYRE